MRPIHHTTAPTDSLRMPWPCPPPLHTCLFVRRDFFLEPANYKSVKTPLVTRFGELMRKLWNTRNFKGQVGPGSPAATHPWWHSSNSSLLQRRGRE